jgi:hypothetical protein
MNPLALVMPRVRPTIEAGLMLVADATALFMRPVLIASSPHHTQKSTMIPATWDFLNVC